MDFDTSRHNARTYILMYSIVYDTGGGQFSLALTCALYALWPVRELAVFLLFLLAYKGFALPFSYFFCFKPTTALAAAIEVYRFHRLLLCWLSCHFPKGRTKEIKRLINERGRERYPNVQGPYFICIGLVFV